MTSSLVGSEMCIRDRPCGPRWGCPSPGRRCGSSAREAARTPCSGPRRALRFALVGVGGMLAVRVPGMC
eukprot:7773212-Prorocentrum_lima.AAC.1